MGKKRNFDESITEMKSSQEELQNIEERKVVKHKSIIDSIKPAGEEEPKQKNTTKKKYATKKKIISVSISPNVYERAMVYCERNGLSFSAMVTTSITLFMDRSMKGLE